MNYQTKNKIGSSLEIIGLIGGLVYGVYNRDISTMTSDALGIISLGSFMSGYIIKNSTNAEERFYRSQDEIEARDLARKDSEKNLDRLARDFENLPYNI